MATWFTADTHFFHEGLLQIRPQFKNVHEMNAVLIANWNEIVKDDEDIWVLGDFAWGGPERATRIEHLIEKLNGRKHLIYGNHDRLHIMQYVEFGFTTVHSALELPGKKFVLAHDPAIANCISDNQTLLHGHIHKKWKHIGNMYNVGVDVHDFRPISFSSINAEVIRSSVPPQRKETE